MSIEQQNLPLVAETPKNGPEQVGAGAAAQPVSSPLLGISLALLRFATGFIFLWAFLDKAFGLGYSTTSAKSWFSGGSPTKGFLGHVDVGPFQSLFTGWAGAVWVDWLFMLGMAGVGIAVILGIGLRLSAIAGSIIMLMMWAAEWPLARFNSVGELTGSTNPFVDYHIIYALALIVIAVAAGGNYWGLGKRWAKLPVVRKFGLLR